MDGFCVISTEEALFGSHACSPAMSDSAWTRLSVDSGLDVEIQSNGLQDHLTSVHLIFFLWRYMEALVYSEPTNDWEILEQWV
jgi:hypothetical protein